MRHLPLIAALLACAGCGGKIVIPPETGDYFTIDHRAGRFDAVAKAAAEHCAARGKQAKHTGTDVLGGRWPVSGTPYSRFECVPK